MTRLPRGQGHFWKFDRGLTHLLYSELHWLDVPQQILYKLGVTVHRCLQGKARSKSLTTGNVRCGVKAVHEVLGSLALETQEYCHSELMEDSLRND